MGCMGWDVIHLPALLSRRTPFLRQVARDRLGKVETRRAQLLQNDVLQQVAQLEARLVQTEGQAQALREQIRDREAHSNLSEAVRSLLNLASDLNAHLMRVAAI